MRTLIQGGDIVAYHDGGHRQGLPVDQLSPLALPPLTTDLGAWESDTRR
ncbi:MAG: hypothetical protein ACREMB_17375 [Candidatus Rokuibacteriota bacterium]